MASINDGKLSELVHKMIDGYCLYDPPRHVQLPLDDVFYIIDQAMRTLAGGNALIEIEAPMCICGDTHGQYADLIRIFEVRIM